MSIKATVTDYIKANVTIYMPDNEACCYFCPLMHGHDRKQCALTGAYIANDRVINGRCPLEFEVVNNE